MFHVSFATGFFVYLFIWIIYLTILWIRETWRTDIREWSLSQGKLCICDDCKYAFLVKPRETTAICPKCGQLTIVKKSKTKRAL